MDENKIELTDDRQRWSLEEAEADFENFAASFDWSTPDWDVPAWDMSEYEIGLEPRTKHGTNESSEPQSAL